MTYVPTIPNPTDLISVSQGQLKTNFTVLNTTISENHVAPTAVGRGKHNACVFPQRAAGIATAATEGAIYTKSLGGSPNLYWRRKSNGAEIQMTTNHTPSAAANGYTFLPGGLLLQWGTNHANAGDTTFNFPIAFSVAPYSITITLYRTTGGTVQSLYVVSGTPPTTTQFTVYKSGGGQNFFWMAIGRA